MTISTAPDDMAQFVATDNVAGFYENYTRSYGRGGGYVSGKQTVMHDYAVFANGMLIDRRTPSAVEHIIPNGHRSQLKGVTQSLLVHSGHSGLSIRVQADANAMLAIALLLPEREHWVVTQHDDVLQISDESGGYVVVLTADKPVTLVKGPTEGRTVGGALASLASDVRAEVVMLQSQMPTQQLTLQLAVATSAEAAGRLGDGLRKNDSWLQTEQRLCQRLQAASLTTPDVNFNRALLWASHSAQSFVVEEFGTGIWAGLPWFRDNWGRDTFIALPGTLLTSGQFAMAKAVLQNFARRQKRDNPRDPEYGRIPNRVAANDRTIYNTLDGTPWLIREALEYLRYTGDAGYSQQWLPLIRRYIAGVEQHWLDRDGLLTHDDADTWMDARIANRQAWSPRGNRAVEVQALWFTALDAAATLAEQAGEMAEATRYRQQAARVQSALLSKFWNGERMADRLLASGHADESLRPNQLMVVSIPFSPVVPDTVQAKLTRNAVQGLLLPYGMLSLAPSHPNFHPRHENPAFHHKDATYHNGTIWGWNAGFIVTALTKFGQQEMAWQLSRNLAEQILSHGTRGNMSELVDALPSDSGQINPSGTYAQAWSVAEFVRNAYQDYLGFRPNLLVNELHFVPALPRDWSNVSARLPFGEGERLKLDVVQQGNAATWCLTPDVAQQRYVVMDLLDLDGNRRRLRFALTGKPQCLHWDGHKATLDGASIPTTQSLLSQRAVIGALRFLTPPPYRKQDYSVLNGKDVLQQRILEAEQASPSTESIRTEK